MSSYFNRQTTKRDERPHRLDSHRPSGHERLGLPPPFAALPARPAQPDTGHQPPLPIYGLLGRGGAIPPPPGHARASPSFACPRCKQAFGSPHELGQHSFACAASALVTGMFTPYSSANAHAQQPSQPSSQPPYAQGGYPLVDQSAQPYSGQGPYGSYGSTPSAPNQYGSYQSGTGRQRR